VIKTPLPAAATGAPHKLATVDLKVIDILGQLGKAEAYAMYYPGGKAGSKEYPHKHASIIQDVVGPHKEATVVARVIGLAVAVAIMVFLAFQNYSVLDVPTRTVHEEQSPPLVKQPTPPVEQPPPPLRQPPPPVEQPPPAAERPPRPAERPPPGYGESSSGPGQSPSEQPTRLG
jgi:hypothetical protein